MQGHCTHKLTDAKTTCSRLTQDQSSRHSNMDRERTHALREGNHISLKVWPLVGCHALVEDTVPMHIQEA